MYYLVEQTYVGPNRKDSDGNHLLRGGELGICTEPGRRNMSHEPATSGWLGTTNDVAEYAHGAYETLEAARAAAVELGYTVVRDASDYGDCDVVEVRVSAADAREQLDACDWLGNVWSYEQQIAELGITVATTDAELSAIGETLTAEARGDGIELHEIDDHLASLRAYAHEALDE